MLKILKLLKIEANIPIVSNLATKTALTTVEIKIPSVSSLVNKTDYNTKITEIENELNNHNHDKYITTPEFNTLAADVFNARLARANLQKQILVMLYQALIIKLHQIKQKMSLLIMN